MSFHFCSHAWEVRDLDDGVIVSLRNRDFDAENLACLADELIVLITEAGKPVLYLDFENIGLVSSGGLGKLTELNAALRQKGLQLKLLNLNSALRSAVDTLRLDKHFDIRTADAAGAIA
jgi:anti-anti-sigma regulatory factor